MNDTTWIKLYRKILNNDELFRSRNTFPVLCWLLLLVDRKSGTATIGRYMGAKWLKIKPSSFYVALRKLENMKIIQQQSNNKMTTVTILNWFIYQAKPSELKSEDNEILTTTQQQNNTIQEYKNKDKDNIYNNEPIKNSDEFSEFKKEMGIPNAPVKGITQEFQSEAFRIIEALNVPKSRWSAYFKVVKEEPRKTILEAFGFVIDHPVAGARDKMFFWKLNELKGGLREVAQANN